MKKRILYLDLAKLFTIYLVILGHVIFMMHDGLKIGGCLYNFIYSFHMPLFMLLSGYFVSNKMMSISFPDMFLQKFKQLLLPAIACTIICCVYLYFARDNVNYRDEIIGNSWFLKTLFVYYVIIYLLNRIPINITLSLIITTILLFIIPGCSTMLINHLWPYFCVGFLIKKYNVLNKIYGSWLFSIGFIILFVVSYSLQSYYDMPNYIAININTLYHQPFYHLLRFLVALSGSMSVVLVCSIIDRYISKSKFYTDISSFGKYTLGIYVLQTFLVINVFPDTFAWYVGNKFLFSYVVTPLLSLLFLIACLLLIHLLSKNKIIDLLFFGGQYYYK